MDPKPTKIVFIVFGIVLGFSFLALYPPAKTEAANCGGATPCNCGDTVTSNYTLSSDLSCPTTSGLIIGASGITIDGNGNSIIGTDFYNEGITNGVGGWDNITVKNFNKITGFEYGIYLLNSDSPVIQDNVLEENYYNLRLESSPSANISGNSLSKPAGLGSCNMYLYLSDSATVSLNNFGQNHEGLRISNSNSSTISNNNFNHQKEAISLEGTSSGNNVNNNIVKTSSTGINSGGSSNTISENKIINSNQDITGSGANTATDVEISEAELNQDIPVYSIADGTVREAKLASGYGSIIVIQYNIGNGDYTALYGHIDIASFKVKAGSSVKKGDQLALLGKECSVENGNVRKHLHFGIHKGTAIDIRGYVSSQAELANWLDPLQLYN